MLMHTLYMRKQVNEKTSQLTGNFIFFDGEKVCLCRNSKSSVKKTGGKSPILPDRSCSAAFLEISKKRDVMS